MGSPSRSRTTQRQPLRDPDRRSALATTSVMQRRWGPEQHHLIDPRVGLPARTPVVQATVWEPTCAAAEVASKRATLEGIPALEHVAGVLVLASGEVVMNLEAAV